MTRDGQAPALSRPSAQASQRPPAVSDALRADLHRARRVLRELLDPWLRRDPAGRCRAAG